MPDFISSILNSPVGHLNQHLKVSQPKKKKSKYGNKKCVVDDIEFDSIKEAERYKKLKILLKAGEIGLLERQRRYLLIEGNETERKCEYLADFVYIETKTGKTIVEDVKGFETEVFKIKRKLMKDVHGIEIKVT